MASDEEQYVGCEIPMLEDCQNEGPLRDRKVLVLLGALIEQLQLRFS
jgi:hypothetical protein